MEQFEIQLLGQLLTIKPQDDGSYQVYEGANLLGVLTPHINDQMYIDWVTADLMGRDYAHQIGELIEEHEM